MQPVPPDDPPTARVGSNAVVRAPSEPGDRDRRATATAVRILFMPWVGMPTKLRPSSRYARGMTGSAGTTQRRAKVRPLLSDEEWAALEPHLAAWLASGLPTPPVASADAIRTAVYTMASGAVDHCITLGIFIELHKNGFTPTWADERRHDALRSESWTDRLFDKLPRAFAPHIVEKGEIRTRDAKILQRIRKVEDPARWPREIENLVWFLTGSAMRRAVAHESKRVAAEVETFEESGTPESELGWTVPKHLADGSRPQPSKASDVSHLVPAALELMLKRAGGKHSQCAIDLATMFASISPQSQRRPALLLAEEYRIGRIDRAWCHMHYRALPVSASGATLGQLLDILDRRMGLPSNLKPYSTRRSQPDLPVLEQPVMRTALAELGVETGADIASVFRKLRDALEKVLAQDPEIIRLRAASRSGGDEDGMSFERSRA